MSIQGHPVWTLVESIVLCLCVIRMSHAAGTFGVSDIFTLDTREEPASGLSNLFVLDTREPGSNVEYSNLFALDTREPISNECASNHESSNWSKNIELS